MNGKPKQLLEFRGKTLLRHSADTAVEAKFDAAVVVLGANYDKFQSEIQNLPVQTVINEIWQTGMSSSVKTGLNALSAKKLDAVIIMLCDQPLITAKILQNLANLFIQTGKLVIACEYAETTGVPALFSSEIFDELMNLKRDEGAKKIIKKYQNDAVLILTPEAAFDVDTIEDYEKIKEI